MGNLFSSGGGSGGDNDNGFDINYISNFGAEENASDWNTYADAAAASPVDGTGGSPNVTLTRTTTASEIIRGTGSFKLTKDAADRQGEGGSYDFTIDKKDQGGEVFISVDYKVTANYASGDIRAFVYDVTNSNLIGALRNNDDGDFLSHTGNGTTFLGAFTAASDSTSYRLIFHITSTNASSYDFIYDRVRAFPDSPIPGYIGHGAKAISGSVSNLSTNIEAEGGYYWRDGDRMKVSAVIEFSGANTDGFLQPAVPAGESVDESKIASITDTGTGDRHVVGSWRLGDAGTGANNDSGNVVYDVGDSTFYLDLDGTSGVVNPGGNTPITIADGDTVSWFFEVPISGWKASASLSSTEVLFQTASANMSLSATQNITTTDETTIELDVSNIDKFNGVDTGNNKYVIPKDGDYLLMAQAFTSGTTDSDSMRLTIKKNGSTSLARSDMEMPAGAANNTLVVHAFAALEKNDEITITSKSSSDTDYNILSDAAGSGTITGLTVLRWPDFSTFSHYLVNDLVEAIGAQASYSITADQYGDLDSIDLTPGEWDITATAVYISSGTTTTDRVFIGLGTGSGTTAPNLGGSAQSALNRVGESMDNTTGQKKVLNLSFMGYQVTDTTTVYFKAFAETNTTNLEVAYKIQARKIK